MAISVLHCIKCEERFDIRGEEIEGRTVRCPLCGLKLTTDLSDWGMARKTRDDYRKKVLAGCKLKSRVRAGRDSFTYRAEHQDHDVPVLFEVFPHDRAGYDEDWIVRLFRGLAEASKLRHPNVVVLYDLGRREEYDFCIRELADGGSVRAMIEDHGRVPLDEALPLAEDALRALKVAERRDLCSGRISPDTCLLDYDGSLKLDDFGRPYHPLDLEEFVLTEAGNITGPCYYVSPEQVRDHKDWTIKSDLYSVGLTLYEMLCGRRAFTGRGAREIMNQRLEGAPVAPGTINSDLPPEVCEFIEDLTQPDPDDRPESASAALVRLREMAEVLSTRPKVKDAPTIARDRQSRRQRLRAVLWTILAFVLIALAIFPLYKLAREEEHADEQAIAAASPTPHSGRVLVVIRSGADRVDPERRRALLTMVAMQVSGLGSLTAVDPFLTEEMLSGENSLDRALLKTDPAYVLRAAATDGPSGPWVLSFSGVKGQEWRMEETVDDVTVKSMNDGVEALLRKAASRMGLPGYEKVAGRQSETFWGQMGEAIEAERTAQFEKAIELLEELEDSSGQNAPFVRVLGAYCRQVLAWKDADKGMDVDPGELPAEAAGEFSSLAPTLKTLRTSDESAIQQALAQYLAERPESPRAHYLLGLWRHRTGRPADEALAAYRHAIETDPGYLPAARAAARVASRKGRESVEKFLSRYRELAWQPQQINAVEDYCNRLLEGTVASSDEDGGLESEE